MVTSRYNSDKTCLFNLAKGDHKNGYEIEAFSILYECIRYNQSRLISVKTNDPIKIENYKKLENKLKKYAMLDRNYIRNIGNFHTNRTKIIHEIINENFDSDEIDKWFKEGIKINQRLISEIKMQKSSYGKILFSENE